MKNLKKERGITLIALVVTIVVLLILAGISLNMVLGNNGLITKAKDAKVQTEQDAVNTETAMNNLYNEMMGALGESTSGNSGTNTNTGIVEPENIDDWEYTVEDDGTITLTMYKGSATEVVIPNYINGIPVKTIGTNERYDNEYDGVYYSIWSPDICEEVTIHYTVSINQSKITKVTISEGIEVIDERAFYYSTALQEIILPTTITTIGYGAFEYCSNLASITIPDSVMSIESSAFYECNNLTTVNYRGTEEKWSTISIGSSNTPLTNATIVYNYSE